MGRLARTLATVGLAAALALFGYIGLSMGWRGFGAWGSVSASLKAFFVLSAACGVAMWFSALTLLVSRGRRRFPAWCGAAASSLLGIGLIAGILTYVIPCSGPT